MLAPARDLECGMAAIDHGADAVYIGAARFGARAAAGNSVDDIGQLCDYAHKFAAKVYVTTNTIIYESELEGVFNLIGELAHAGVDALLVQDMAIVEWMTDQRERGRRCALPLHASTQMDNRTAAKVAWLRSLGFSRVVLARELSLSEIEAIHAAVPDVELESFVHGAICVSYSGVCYASQSCFNRSANRGECAQFCRMAYDLIDTDGVEIERNRFLLSMKDMCRIDDLEALAGAGVCSLKIEGRLKNADYVKNVVAAYSMRLNQIIANSGGKYRRVSLGSVEYAFTPSLKKTFNRGFTRYFLHGREANVASFDTPKAIGEFVGSVKEVSRDSFTVAGTAAFANGDGLCFINWKRQLEGFRVNRVDNNRLFPFKVPLGLRAGMALHRNNDEVFERTLSKRSATRKIPVRIAFGVTGDGVSLDIHLVMDSQAVCVGHAELPMERQIAQRPQRENIIKQLTKLGDTVYVCDQIEIEEDADKYFIPSSSLANLRRIAVESITIPMTETSIADVDTVPGKVEYWQKEYEKYPYLYNISNSVAKRFYEKQGLPIVEDSLETRATAGKGHTESAMLMQCMHCLKYSMGYCERHGGGHATWKEPLYLRSAGGRRFRLGFDCAACQMNVYADE